MFGMFQSIIWEIKNSQPNAPSTEQEQKGPGAGLLIKFSSKHSHSEQYWVLTFDPQQSPPSKPHPATLFSSSHEPSPIHWGLGLEQAGIQNQLHSEVAPISDKKLNIGGFETSVWAKIMYFQLIGYDNIKKFFWLIKLKHGSNFPFTLAKYLLCK